MTSICRFFGPGRGQEIPNKTLEMDVKSNELVDVPVAVSEAALRAAGRVDPPPPVCDQGYMSRPSARDSRADLETSICEISRQLKRRKGCQRSTPTRRHHRRTCAVEWRRRSAPRPPKTLDLPSASTSTVAAFSEGHRRGPWRICHRFRILWPSKERRKWLKKRQNEVDVV